MRPVKTSSSLTLTPRQAADYLGFGLTKTLSLIRDKRLECRMLDGRIRVLRSACEEFIQSLPNGYERGEPVYDDTRHALRHVRRAARKAVRS